MITAAGIIAAGHGSRLAASHPGLPKPLVPLAGKPLCHWVVESLKRAGAKEITLLHNSKGRAIRESLAAAFPDVKWTFLEADTASSWESFRLVSSTLAKTHDSFLMSTADSLIPPPDVARFAAEITARQAEAGLALTDFIDDEKPCLAELSPSGILTKLGETCTQGLATSGLYFMTRRSLARMPEPGRFSALREFLKHLVDTTPVVGVVLSKSLDVDRPEDVAQAEGFLKEATATW